MDMSTKTKQHNIYYLNDLVSEAREALENIDSDEIEEVQNNFIRIESCVQELQV